MNKDLESKLSQIKVENRIWIIYLGIIVLSYFANNLEKKYLLNKDNNARKTYRYIMIFIFSILIVVYSYFLIQAYSDLKNLNEDSYEKKKLLIMDFIGSLFVLISGLIFLYIAIKDEKVEVELAFN